MPYDPNTIAGCTWWHDNDGFISCDELLGFIGIPLDRFIIWYLSVTDIYGNFYTGFSYCVEGPAIPITTTPGSSTTTPITTPTTASPSMIITPGNGIATPTPI
ncbi:hypothetical protein QBC40DRAFT_259052 [Triangularia verruculosa]|uniref:Uncharacterized protein n=1 Tax=Triangularia verruculosa TaxID=2587418 RepID=A0AAN7ANJ4_9PEZI|nr:hypothetical protein QBC40DRAFT_259052 [Triangularia verruculosa]